jgi:hypothetical protein
MIRISSLAVALALALLVPASAEESQPSQAPSEKAQSKDLCRSKCQDQNAGYKECSGGVAPMHSPCEMFNLCLQGCN